MSEQALDKKSDGDNGANANDALERIKKKNHPVVESRDASLNSTSPDTSMSGILQNQISTNLESDMSGNKDTQENSKAEIAKQDLETKQSTLRLEAKVSDHLQTLCREQGICREVLIEAMFEYCQTHPKVLSAVLTKAKDKNDYRQEIANRRRAKSMMEKFGG
jgi:hypothetical protein